MPVGRKEAFSIQFLQLADAALVWLAFWLADLVRGPLRELLDQSQTAAGGLSEVTWLLYVAVPFTPLVLEFHGFYRRLRSKTPFQSISKLLRAGLVMGLALGLLALFARLPGASRLMLAVGGFLTLLLIFLRDRAVAAYLSKRAVREDSKDPIFIVGTDEETRSFLEGLDAETRASVRVVGCFDIENSDVASFYEALKSHSVERVIFTAGGTGFAKVAEFVEACELQGIEAWVAASFMRTQVARPTFDLMGGKPMLVLRSTPELSWELFLKEVFDRVVAGLLILATFWLWVFAWVGIRISSPGASAFFCQNRAGKYGKPFRMWKFRTMVPDAEHMLDRIKEEHGNEMEGPVFKLGRDPRVFRFGALLRKLSIDELPQLWNVLRGDISMVGPRPLPLYEVEAFQKSAHRRRLSVKPGITCEWQAGGRNRITSFEEWVEMDLRYIDNWSFWLDIKLLLKTVPAVIFGMGAK